jgi:mediator of RNA polymerase II transcription subunit 12
MRNPVPHGFKGVELFDSMFAPQLTPASNHHRSVSGTGPPQPPSPIPIDRAIWFIRVLGANEISAHRGRAQPPAVPVAAPSPIPATPSSTNTAPLTATLTLSSNDWYTQEFTNMFTSWIRVQLGQLVLPVKIAAKSGVPPPKGPVGVLGDEKARAKWLAKWGYR